MQFTVQKLQQCITELSKASEGISVPISPIFVAPASGQMMPPALIDKINWNRLEVGQIWGIVNGTSWLMTNLQVPRTLVGQPVVLQLFWDTEPKDSLLLHLEATAFLDGSAIGGFDWRHRTLLMPVEACDGQSHVLMIQVYTDTSTSFGGLTISARKDYIWRLYHCIHTLLDVYLTMDENDVAGHMLLERLNIVYNMLDLREGWRSERLAESARIALNYLQTYVKDGLAASPRPHIVVNGHAHLDAGWLWPYWRTRQKIVHTISNVLGLMDRYPYYYYSQSQPQLLQWLKEDAPEIYAQVKKRIAEGRMEVVGAMWVEPDCILISGESLIRQLMHGTRFIQQEFGITPQLVWLPDAFGYTAALPQIMRGCNISIITTTKLSWNEFNRMPCDTFRWRGIDGSEVLMHFITAPVTHKKSSRFTYNGPLNPRDIVGTWEKYLQQSINDQLLYLCGWGNGGGGPTEDQLERIPIMADLPSFPTVSMGRATEFFTALYGRVWHHPGLPNWVGELYLEFHRGIYTSQAGIKRANREAELFYREVELLNSWASIYGMPSRQERLNEGWQHILLNQFHDVLPGSSIREVYDDAERLYAEARAIGERVRNEAVDIITKHLSPADAPYILLNTLPWERTDPVQLPIDDSWDMEGMQQTTGWEENRVVLIDGVSIPSCGAITLQSKFSGTFDLSGLACYATPTEAGQIVMHNNYYELTLDEYGEISRIYDKLVERDVFASGQAGNQLVAYEDRPLTFDVWNIDSYYEEKPYPLHEARQIRVIEEGPVRTTVEILRHFMSSRIKQRISLWRSSPRIDFATEIDWHEHQTLLKAIFPLAINSSRATYEIQFGSVERPTHRNTSWDQARFEVYAHRWIDLSEGGYGVSLLNDSKYGHDIHDNVVRLTLLKCGVLPDPNADQGLHRFNYSLLPHRGDWCEAHTVRHAYELNVPVFNVVRNATSSVHANDMAYIARFSFVSVDCFHVVMETVKPAEDGDGLIVRLYEAHNQRGRGSPLTFATDITSAQECNLLEVAFNDADYQGNRLLFYVNPFEIKTFRIRLAEATSNAK